MFKEAVCEMLRLKYVKRILFLPANHFGAQYLHFLRPLVTAYSILPLLSYYLLLLCSY